MQTRDPSHTPRFRAARPGAALLLILGLVLVMSIVLTAFLQLVEQQLKLRGLYQDNEELRTQAYCALEATLSVLTMFSEKDKGLYSPVQGWGTPLYFASLDPLVVTLEEGCGITNLEYPDEEREDPDAREARLAAMTPEERARTERLEERKPREIFDFPPLVFPNGIKVDVEITDETGKIPITKNYAEVLSEAFVLLGISESQADELVDSLMDWIDTDDDMRPNGAEQNYYDTQTPPVIVPNRALQTLDELRYIKGFAEVFYDTDGQPNEKWVALKDMVTLHSHSKINLNTAPLSVLGVLEVRGDLKAEDITNYRNGNDSIFGTQDDMLIRKLSDVNITAGSADKSGDNELTGEGSFSSLFGVNCQLLHIRITASRGDSRFTLSLLAKVGSSSSTTTTTSSSTSTTSSSSSTSSSKGAFSIQEIQENREIE